MIEDGLSCPLPLSAYDRVVLAHGGGGRVMHRLIESLFVRAFANDALDRGHDGALVEAHGPIAITTDAFTVSPLFFPGGDIGRLAICGTVNDLAMCGARPGHLTAAFVLEEGFPLDDLARIVDSMASCVRECGAAIVAGDTKVVERGKGDGVYISMAGVGEVVAGAPIGPERVQAGDAVIASGPLGDHGIAVMSVREGIGFECDIESDVAPLHGPVLAALESGVDVHCLRDATRGGFATVLAEIAVKANVGVRLREVAVPVRDGVADACELLGLDPLYVACEGRFAAFVPPTDADRFVAVLRDAGCPEAVIVGEITTELAGEVVMESTSGGERMLDVPAGEQLPRIC